MNFELNPSLSEEDWKAMSMLYDLVEWDHREPEEIEDSFQKSKYVFVARQRGELIAFSRTVDDGKYYALIVDVVVHPKHQGKGIGTRMVNKLSGLLKGYNFITLTAAPGKDGFYEKLGWKKQRSAYILPSNEKQEMEHCEEQ